MATVLRQEMKRECVYSSGDMRRNRKETAERERKRTQCKSGHTTTLLEEGSLPCGMNLLCSAACTPRWTIAHRHWGSIHHDIILYERKCN